MQPSESSTPWRSTRTVGLRRTRADAFRVYAMLVIILGHSEMAMGRAGDDGPSWIQLGFNVAGRIAVPLFLLLAGNHLGPKLMRDRGAQAVVRPYVRRLFGMFAGASILYWAWDAVRLIRRNGLAGGLAALVARDFSDPLVIVFQGARPHLWFLVALMMTVVLTALLINRSRIRTFVAVSVALYAAALAVGPYRDALGIGGPYMGLERYLQSPLFFAMGLLLSFEQLRARWSPMGPVLLLVGLVVHALEAWWVSTTFGTDPFRLAVLVGTVPFAFGTGLIAVQPGARSIDRLFARAAGLVPAVYLNHMFFLELFRPPRDAFNLTVVRVALPALVVVTAFGSAWLAFRFRVWRRRRARAAETAAREPSREGP